MIGVTSAKGAGLASAGLAKMAMNPNAAQGNPIVRSLYRVLRRRTRELENTSTAAPQLSSALNSQLVVDEVGKFTLDEILEAKDSKKTGAKRRKLLVSEDKAAEKKEQPTTVFGSLLSGLVQQSFRRRTADGETLEDRIQQGFKLLNTLNKEPKEFSPEHAWRQLCSAAAETAEHGARLGSLSSAMAEAKAEGRRPAAIHDGCALIVATARNKVVEYERIRDTLDLRLDQYCGRILEFFQKEPTEDMNQHTRDDYNRLEKFAHAFFSELEFRPDFSGKRNSFLIDKVLETKQGNYVSLAVIFLALARRIGIELAPVEFSDPQGPKHKVHLLFQHTPNLLVRLSLDMDGFVLDALDLPPDRDYELFDHPKLKNLTAKDFINEPKIWFKIMNGLALAETKMGRTDNGKFWVNQMNELAKYIDATIPDGDGEEPLSV